MTLTQLENLVKINEDLTNPEHGVYYDQRPIESLLEYGLILIDKPPGPTSHEVVAWTKRILDIPKITRIAKRKKIPTPRIPYQIDAINDIHSKNCC